MIALRGRRQVGKSRLVEIFCEQASGSNIYFQATRRRAPGSEIDIFRSLAARALGARGEVLGAATFHHWDGVLGALAEAVQDPLIVVLDELPWLVEQDSAVEGALQTAWDRHLRNRPILVILIGSDLAMMEALTEYGRPLYDRARIMAIEPLAPSEVGQLVGGEPAEVLDAYLVVGGFPNLVRQLARSTSLRNFLRHELGDPTSRLIVSGERALSSEFPPEAHTRAVLDAIGVGEREHKSIASESGVGGATLDRSLGQLSAKRATTKLVPYSTESGGRRSRYQIIDPYLRFWLRYIGPALPEIERGRGHIVAQRVIDDFSSFSGHSIEPIVREALARLLPDSRFGEARYVGAYWTRDGRTEVDLVGGQRHDRAVNVEFLGSIKWRRRLAFDQRDCDHLALQRVRVPGSDAQTPLIAVSRSGFRCDGLTVALGPSEILNAW